eukprot:CAMPEP_0206263932 /NCGR_PEP_ID=MMETSP0047_2-20121206/29108_1 /ASSEMBLY_ACC=CAM_ASM_000192 /TAXON_ID=195065 /ORGANISM="Chroomonas mesostigmatica_cf, Strain CCMP1168" /LENGTH=43 /DNA_ID= /DNA_START= /DNA_END= /DNA_ORIENTATION=
MRREGRRVDEHVAWWAFRETVDALLVVWLPCGVVDVTDKRVSV